METRGNGPGLDEPVGFGPVASRGLFSDGLMEKLHFFLKKNPIYLSELMAESEFPPWTRKPSKLAPPNPDTG